jgi:hypothetical protein
MSVGTIGATGWRRVHSDADWYIHGSTYLPPNIPRCEQHGSYAKPVARKVSTSGRTLTGIRMRSRRWDMLVADRGDPTMFARIGVMRALNRHVERVFDSSRKEKHWGKRKLARDR